LGSVPLNGPILMIPESISALQTWPKKPLHTLARC